MAKVKTSSLLAEIRGNLGGTVFSSNGAGFYCKQLVVPVNPRSQRQSLQRSYFSQITNAWLAISESDYDLWVTYAARPDTVQYDYFGDPYYPTPFNQFMSVNMYRLLTDSAISYTAPVVAPPDALPSTSVYVDFQEDVTNSSIHFNVAPAANNHYLHISASIWTNKGRATAPKTPLFLDTVYKDQFPTINIQSFLTATFGTLPTDGRWRIDLFGISGARRFNATKTFIGYNKETVTI